MFNLTYLESVHAHALSQGTSAAGRKESGQARSALQQVAVKPDPLGTVQHKLNCLQYMLVYSAH